MGGPSDRPELSSGVNAATTAKSDGMICLHGVVAILYGYLTLYSRKACARSQTVRRSEGPEVIAVSVAGNQMAEDSGLETDVGVPRQ